MWDQEEEHDGPDYRETAIYQKAMDITVLAHKIGELIDDEAEEFKPLVESKSLFLESAYIIPAKIAGCAAVFYDLKMENAALVRKASRELLTFCRSLEMFGFKETQYLDIIRDEVEELRLLFIDWVDGFDAYDYIIDRWGLFNPPGVGPHDHDPDDDIPFNPDDLDL
jgi:hypothetical protein